MTDFLDRLASSILGEAPVAQPLIAPRFAPGAEIFAPDTPMADDLHAAPSPTGYEQSSDTMSSIAPPVTAFPPIEERHPADLQHGEQGTLSIEQAAQRSQELAHAADFRNKPAQEPQRGTAAAVPLAAFGTAHAAAPQAHLHDLETKNLPASAPEPTRELRAQKSESPPPAGPATSRLEVQRIAPLDAREQPVGVEPSHLEKSTRPQVTPVVRETGEILPPDEIHGVAQFSESISPERRSARDPSNVESRRTGPDRMATPLADSPVRPLERPPSLRTPDALEADRRTSDVVGEKHDERIVEQQPAREVTLAPAEVEPPEGAAQVRYASRGARVVRPERISALGHADSTTHAPASDKAPGIQAAPTIKVTIGRIEVRAVSPPQSQPQETALPAPKLSLDDYLKSLRGRR